MTYPSYRQAAERHLEVCLQLLFILEELQKKETRGAISARELLDKTKILSNLYYLSGYIIECAYNCAIYKFVGWTGNVTRLQAHHTVYSVSCLPPAPGTTCMFTIRRRSGASVKQHQLSGNMHFFQTIAPIPSLSGIPLIGYDISGRLSSDLFDAWNAEVRYVVDGALILDYSNVFDFFYLAVEVYEGLLTNSMI